MSRQASFVQWLEGNSVEVVERVVRRLRELRKRFGNGLQSVHFSSELLDLEGKYVRINAEIIRSAWIGGD